MSAEASDPAPSQLHVFEERQFRKGDNYENEFAEKQTGTGRCP
jgi:hypothetical protein